MKLDFTGLPVKLIIIALAGIGAVSLILKIIPNNSQAPTSQNPISQILQNNSLEKIAEEDETQSLVGVGLVIPSKDIKVEVLSNDGIRAKVKISTTLAGIPCYIPYDDPQGQNRKLQNGEIFLSENDKLLLTKMGLAVSTGMVQNNDEEKWLRCYRIQDYVKSGDRWLEQGVTKMRYIYPASEQEKLGYKVIE